MSNTVFWFSGSPSSAIALKLYVEKNFVKPIVIRIKCGLEHEQEFAFQTNVSRALGININIIQSKEFTDHFNVFRKLGKVRDRNNFTCQQNLKHKVRMQFLDEHPEITTEVWGLSCDNLAEKAAFRILGKATKRQEFPLITSFINKRAAIKQCAELYGLPYMYANGFINNNCLACPKGGIRYWRLLEKQMQPYYDFAVKEEQFLERPFLKRSYLPKLIADHRDAPIQEPIAIDSCGLDVDGCKLRNEINPQINLG